jgi:hypothetical protein
VILIWLDKKEGEGRAEWGICEQWQKCYLQLATIVHLIYIVMSEVLKNKLSANAKHFRFLSRA